MKFIKNKYVINLHNTDFNYLAQHELISMKCHNDIVVKSYFINDNWFYFYPYRFKRLFK